MNTHGLDIGTDRVSLLVVLFKREGVPSTWFSEINSFDFFQVKETIFDLDGDTGRGVTFVSLEIDVDAYRPDLHFLLELDVYEVRLGTVTLPKCISVIISQLI